MSETLRDVAVELAGRLASAYAGMYDPYSSDEFLKRQHKLMAGYMERIGTADQERTCHIDTPIIDWETGETDFICSTCGYNADPQDWAEEFKFCPNCGARVVSCND